MTLLLRSTSRSSDAGHLAAKDLADIAAALNVEYRLVGGNAVSLMVAASGAGSHVPPRETADADFGTTSEVVADPRLPVALTGLGYEKVAGNHFVRAVGDPADPLQLAVDLLIPSFSGQLESNQAYGDLAVDAVPGLAVALSRPGVRLDLEVQLTDGAVLATSLVLPDALSLLCLKAYAYKGRLQDRDALDIWRLLEAAKAAGHGAAAWPAGATGKDAARILHDSFGGVGSPGLKRVSRDRVAQTRVRALVQEIVPTPSSWD